MKATAIGNVELHSEQMMYDVSCRLLAFIEPHLCIWSNTYVKGWSRKADCANAWEEIVIDMNMMYVFNRQYIKHL